MPDPTLKMKFKLLFVVVSITSFWTFVESADTPTSSSTTEITINPSETHQTMEGFGACFVTYQMDSDSRDPHFYDQMVYDLGVTIVRCPMQMSWDPTKSGAEQF